jgi:hypothetical protein
MSRSRVSVRSVLGAALILALACVTAFPAFAVEPIRKGADLWISVAGHAKTSFEHEPIPAGFFCASSQPFTGAIAFRGAPLATEPAGVLGGVDTVVRRLDDAVFNEKGEATTRIQLMALSLASVKPIETSCGSYQVAAHLDGEQPTTTMHIFSSEALGGTYSAPLALNVKLVFTPVAGDRGARRELTRRIDLGPAPQSVWVYVNKPLYPNDVKIDTRGDGRAETALPASSNFLAGVGPAVLKSEPSRPRLAASTSSSTTYPSDPGPPPTCGNGYCPHESCHCALGPDGNPDMSDPYRSGSDCAQDHLHCLWVCVPKSTSQPQACTVIAVQPNSY